MGSLVLLAGSKVYVDTPVIIYTVEYHMRYGPLLDDLWDAAAEHRVAVTSSELTRLEALVRPIRHSQAQLILEYRQLLEGTDLALCPISTAILDQAARLRATHSALRTPDAIHVATAMVEGCTMFLTNDRGLTAVSSLPVTLLDDVLASP